MFESVARADLHPDTAQSSENTEVDARIRFGRCVGQDSGMPGSSSAVRHWDRQKGARDRQRTRLIRRRRLPGR